MTSRTRAWACVFLCLSAPIGFTTAQEDLAVICGLSTGTSCPPVPALGETIHIDFRTRTLGDYIAKVNGPLDFDNPTRKEDGKGLALLLTDDGDAPKVEVPQHIFFGRVDVLLQAAPDPGIVTSLVLVSPDGDEIDFEWTGANDNTVQTNFFSKANTSVYNRAGYHAINGSSTAFHTYSISWGTKRLQWLVDGNVVRTLDYHKEDDGTSNGFPQTPMSVRIGCWATGRHTTPAGTIEWAGGVANFADGPKRGYVKTLNITDDAYNSPARQPKYYTWNDMTGLYPSIGAKYEDPGNGTTTNSTGTSSETMVPMGGGGLGTGGIAGIVVGFVAAFAMIGTLAAILLAQRRKRAKQEEEEAASARDHKLRNMSFEEVGGVDNKPELDGSVLIELSGSEDKEVQELDEKGDMRVEMSEDNNPQELSPVGSDESEEAYYEKLRSVAGLKTPRDDPPDGKDEGDV